MSITTIWIICGLLLVIIEFFSPTMFFLTLGLACFITSLFAYVGLGGIIQACIFLFSALFLLLFVKPIFSSIYKNESNIESKYIGHTVKVIKRTDKSDGRITIYGEDWQAKSLNPDVVFEVGEEAKIIKNESLIMYIDKI